LPLGGIKSPSVLQTLHDALALRGPLSVACDIANRLPERQWLLSYPLSSTPSCYKGIQTAVLKILSIDESCGSDLSTPLINTCVVTFRLEICGMIVPQHDWFPKLDELLKSVSSFLRVC